MQYKKAWMLIVCAVCAVLPGGQTAKAVGLKFDYKDPKEISAVSLTVDAMLEPIVGFAKGISGTVVFDPARPQATTGRIAVDVASIQFTNDGYTATARGYALNGEKYPQILFTLRKVLHVTKASSHVYQATVLADFTCHGITTPLTVPVSASYYPGMAYERTDGKYQGDVLVLRTHFNVSRKRQGITRGIPSRMVGDTVEVRVAVVGIHYAPGQPLPGEPVPSGRKAGPAVGRADHWQIELEDRDNALKVDAELKLSGPEAAVVFHTATGDLVAQAVRVAGQRLSFHLPANPLVGQADAVADVVNDRMSGVIGAGSKARRFHGRLATAPVAAGRQAGAAAIQGPGFQNLKIAANGAECSLPERMKQYHVPGIAIARIADFAVAETGYYGVTDVETGEPVNADTLFQVGGMGSPLVNIAALRLASQGLLDLNQEANRYLKRWKIPENEFTRARKITVADLINGSSGLPEYKFMGYRPELAGPSLVEILQGADAREHPPVTPTSQPGAQSVSSGANQAILQLLLMDVTGKSFADLMRGVVFLPLGMTHSTYEVPPAAHATRRIAIGHYASGERMLDGFHIYPAQGESGLWTTAADYARALCQVQKLLCGRDNAILDSQHRDLLKLVSSERRVLGYVRNRAGYLYHGGDPYGYYAEPLVSGTQGYGIVVLQNRMASWDLHNEIVSAVGQQYGWSHL